MENLVCPCFAFGGGGRGPEDPHWQLVAEEEKLHLESTTISVDPDEDAVYM